jgi:hypothetical protein
MIIVNDRGAMIVVIALFLSSIVMTAVFIGLAWFRSPRYLWAAAGMSWIVACFGAWSIGGYLVILTFILAAVALAWELHLRRPWQVTIAVLASIGLWAVVAKTSNDIVLLLPLFLLEPLFEAIVS